jgi:hypothetical protein
MLDLKVASTRIGRAVAADFSLMPGVGGFSLKLEV